LKDDAAQFVQVNSVEPSQIAQVSGLSDCTVRSNGGASITSSAQSRRMAYTVRDDCGFVELLMQKVRDLESLDDVGNIAGAAEQIGRISTKVSVA